MTLEVGTWAIPLAITAVLFLWVFSIKPGNNYDFYPALIFILSLAVSVTAWVVWGFMKVFGG